MTLGAAARLAAVLATLVLVAGADNSIFLTGRGMAREYMTSVGSAYGLTDRTFDMTINTSTVATGYAQTVAGQVLGFFTNQALLQSQLVCTGCVGLTHFPIVGNAFVPIYTLNGVASVALSRSALAHIIEGTITAWNDPVLQALNNNTMPNVPIRLLMVNDPDYLTDLQQILTKFGVTQTTAHWNVNTWFPQETSMILRALSQAGALAIVSSQAAVLQELPATQFVSMYNMAGTKVALTAVSVTAALSTFVGDTQVNVGDITDAPSVGAWPMAINTYVVWNALNAPNCAAATKLAQFLYWVLTDINAISRASYYYHATLPLSVQNFALQQLLAASCSSTNLLAATASLAGSGASFPAKVYSQWMTEFRVIDGTALTYAPTGSGAGITAVTTRTSLFAGSDAIMTPAQYAAGGDLTMYPMVAGAVVLMYNVPEIGDSNLVLDRATTVGIFTGAIKFWNDPAIVALNPSLAALLPNATILPTVRSDSSGTTFIFTTALKAFSPLWTLGSSTLPTWPMTTLKGSGNRGVASQVSTAVYSIGYVGLEYAKETMLPYAQMKNIFGTTLTASVAGVLSAMMDFSNLDTLTPVIVDGPGSNSWPIAGYTYMILHNSTMPDCGQAQRLLRYILWTISSPDAADTAQRLGFTTLSTAMQQRVTNALGLVLCDGLPVVGGCDEGYYYVKETKLCIPCALGYHAPARSTECSPCIPGTFADRPANDCSQCPIATFAAYPAAGACTSCPINATTATLGSTDISQCECVPGFYSNGVLGSSDNAMTCEPCPSGAVCLGKSAPPIPKPGFWSPVDTPGLVFACNPVESCPGGAPGVCAIGYAGSICAQCSTDFYHFERLCLECPDNAVLRYILGAGFFVAAAIISYVVAKKRINSTAITTNFMQITTVFGIIGLKWSKESLILFQMFSPLNWFLYLSKPDCSVPIDYFIRWIIRVTLPFGLMAFVGIMMIGLVVLQHICKAILKCRCCRGSCARTLKSFQQWPKNVPLTHKLMSVASAAIIQFYIFLSQSALEFFACVSSADGSQRLAADASVVCYEGRWNDFLPAACIALIIHVIFIPIALIAIVWKGRTARNEHWFKRIFGYITDRYVDYYYWWEVVIFFRKIIVFIVVVFGTKLPLTVTAFLMLLFGISMSVQMHCSPYKLPANNMLEFVLLGVDLVILCFGVISTETPSDILGIFLLVIVVLPLLLAIIFNFMEFAFNSGAKKLEFFMLLPQSLCGSKKKIAPYLSPAGESIISLNIINDSRASSRVSHLGLRNLEQHNASSNNFLGADLVSHTPLSGRSMAAATSAPTPLDSARAEPSIMDTPDTLPLNDMEEELSSLSLPPPARGSNKQSSPPTSKKPPIAAAATT